MNRRLRFELAALTTLGVGAFALGARLLGNSRPPSSNALETKRRAPPEALWLAGSLALVSLWPWRSFSLEGKSVVVTGGSRGLGLAIARECLMQKAKVTLLARNPDELERARHLLERVSPEVFTVVCDVTSEHQVDKALAEARARFGGIDVLINNAGAIAVGPIDSFERSDFEAQLAVHLRGPLLTSLLVRPYMRMQGGGRIVNISSIGGKVAIPHMAPYCASKFALGGLSESLRTEFARERITVTTVYPGLMRTGSPIQAVFKGDRDREFAWFAAGDAMPGLSIDAARAARRIVSGLKQGAAEVSVSVPSKLASISHALFPESFSLVMETAARFLPNDTGRNRATGAASFDSLKRFLFGRWVHQATSKAARRWNEEPSFDADFNLGVHPV